MKQATARTNCPIGLTLDIVGDKWSLLIIRNLLFANVHTYKELAEFQEKIATNVLAERLERLEMAGIIYKLPDPNDGRKSSYTLSEKGLDFMPVLLEMIHWGMKYNPGASYPKHVVDQVVKDKELLLLQARSVTRAA